MVPQNVEAKAAAKLAEPMMSPTQTSVSPDEYGLIPWMKNGTKTMTKLKENAIPNWDMEMKMTFRLYLRFIGTAP